MEVTNPNTTTPPVSSVSDLAATQAQTTAALSSDFDTFLQMLTAQARYQDPLEPIDSSEYAAQLAQFSMVEQQVLSNDLLTALSAQIETNSIGQMASLIGMEARSTSATSFSGSPISVLPKIESSADDAILIAYGPDGLEKTRQKIPVDGKPVLWDGVQENGAPLPSGSYSFKVESLSLGKSLGAQPAETYSRITEARRDNGATVLVLDSGATVPSAEVTALRE